MIYTVQRTGIKLFATLLFVNLLFLLTTTVAASDGLKSENKEAARTLETEKAEKASDPAQTAAVPELPVISSIMFSDAMKLMPETESIPETPVAESVPDLTENVLFPFPNAAPPMPRVSTAPMTAGEKFKLFAVSSFKPPGPYLQSFVTSMINELTDDNPGQKDTFGNFMADSLTRTARSIGNRAANGFFEKFFYATIFKQDPRYHRSDEKSSGARIRYAITRVFITQGDRSGNQFNASFLLGGLTGATASNAWQRTEKQTGRDTLSRWGFHIVTTMLSNIAREFLGGQ